jgi:hypothetical protein
VCILRMSRADQIVKTLLVYSQSRRCRLADEAAAVALRR